LAALPARQSAEFLTHAGVIRKEKKRKEKKRKEKKRKEKKRKE